MGGRLHDVIALPNDPSTVIRHGDRRTMEVEQPRHDLDAHLRAAVDRHLRRDRDGAIESEYSVGGYW